MSYASLKTLRPFFTNKCGRLLAGGKVYTYEVGTLTPKATYKDAAGLTENTNPIVLDASGETDIYINSDYRFQIFDKDGVLIDDVDSIAPTQRISSAFLSDPSGLTQDQINAAKEDKLNKGVSNGYASLDENAKVPDEQISVIDNLTTDDAKKPVSAKQAKLLKDQIQSIEDIILYTPIAWAKSTAPTGYLVMMGQSISQATYPKLYALYGSTLPDLRAYTIRGLDHGRGIDTGRTVLSEQGDAIRNITGAVGDHIGGDTAPIYQANSGTGAFEPATLISSTYRNLKLTGTGTSPANYPGFFNFKASNVVPTAPENRVKNIAFLYIVKAG